MTSSKISAKDVVPSLINDLGGASRSYVDNQILNMSQTGIPKLMVYPFSVIAETDGQTVFDIDLDTFDANTDTVFVQSGRTMLSPIDDFKIENGNVVLNEGVSKDRIITIYVFKNVPIGEDGSVSGTVLANGSIPLDKLAEMPSAEDVGALPIGGGKVSSNRDTPLIIKNTVGENAYLGLEDKDGNINYIGFEKGKAQVYGKGFIYHTGNKPTASDVGAVAQAPSSGVSTSILEMALTVPNGVHHYILNGSSYTGGDLPHTNYAYSSCTVYRRSKSVIKVYVYGTNGLPAITNYHDGSSWSGWTTEFLPLTGGTLSGNHINFLGGLGNIYTAESLIMLQTFNALGGNAKRKIALRNSKYVSVLANALILLDQLDDGSEKEYKIYGEHNKPSGSYTGNGSATERTISTGGIGNVCAVWGGGYFAFVTRCGAFYAQYATDDSIKWAKQSEIKYLDGIITMATTNSAFNQNGGSYGYQVL